MKAKLYVNQMKLGGSAWEYIRRVENAQEIPVKKTGEAEKGEALGILESFEDTMKPPEEIDLGIMTGEKVIRQMDNDLVDVKVLPYYFSDAARRRGEGITKGSLVTLLGDDRIFEVARVSYEQESVRIRADDVEFVVPWRLVRPCEEEE